MTEQEWETSTNPMLLLEYLRNRASDRKLRLFAVACSRRMWHLLDPHAQAAVEVAERFAEGTATREELREARLACKFAGGHAAWYAAASDPFKAAGNAARSTQQGICGMPGEAEAAPSEEMAQAGLVRDIFGNPYQEIHWEETWISASVVNLAGAIDEQSSFHHMRALGMLLQNAGCNNRDIIDHCLEVRIHVRGCWVVDSILGKH